ncbi:hypothetical protein BHE74_00029112 [Ensete ventricosum]|nr:hypothetical protein GW17_00040737 [Ensete ventricosum]RWW63688.1 hypothetical protein BHE74_00029112 [Ensete ventricosum]RZS07564.1 hypothetical protein BHM03_00038428 [Ensete ventricosum]
MTGAMELQSNDGPRSSLSIGLGFGRCSGILPKFTRRFAEGIRKLTRNMSGDCQKKTIGLTARMSEATGLTGVRSKGATTVHSYGGNFLRVYPGRTIEPLGTRTRVAPRPAMPRPTAPSTAIQAPAPKKLTRDELRERSAKELCWHCDEPWSHEHHRKKGRLLMIEPAEDEDNETSKEALESKEEALRKSPNRPTTQCTYCPATPTRR